MHVEKLLDSIISHEIVMLRSWIPLKLFLFPGKWAHNKKWAKPKKAEEDLNQINPTKYCKCVDSSGSVEERQDVQQYSFQPL